MFFDIFVAINQAWVAALEWWESLISGSGGLPYWLSMTAFVLAVRFVLMPFSSPSITPADDSVSTVRDEYYTLHRYDGLPSGSHNLPPPPRLRLGSGSRSRSRSQRPGYNTYNGRWSWHDGY